MPAYFTVDGRNSLVAGTTLNLREIEGPVSNNVGVPMRTVQLDEMQVTIPEEWAEATEFLFPDGLSRHGASYTLGYHPENAGEAFFELVRRYEFPARPSRYQSIFGARTADEALQFAMRYRKGRTVSIWRVEAAEGFESDMMLVNFVSFPDAYSRARKYWQGENGVNPFREVLLRPPVTAIERVTQVAVPPA